MKLFPVFGAVLALWLPAAAGAFAPVPQAMACMLYFKSDVVFTGQVLAQEIVKGADGDGWVYTLKVLTRYRNTKAATLKVFTAKDPGGLPLTWASSTCCSPSTRMASWSSATTSFQQSSWMRKRR